MEGHEPFYTRGRLVGTFVLLAIALITFSWLGVHRGLTLFFSLPILIVIVCVILGGAYFLHEVRRARRATARERAGCCVKCGYDLRESLGDLCPECGMPIWRRRDPITGKVLSRADAPSTHV